MICTHSDHQENKSCSDFVISCSTHCKCCNPLIHLFTDDERYNSAAHDFVREMIMAIEPIMFNWSKIAKIRDIELITHNVVSDIATEIVLESV